MQIKKIHHRYKNFELEIGEINLPEKSVTGLVGANGAGKTTMMYLLSGMRKANVTMQAEGWNKEEILFIPSELEAYDYLTVKEFAEIVIKYSKGDANAEEILAELNLTEQKEMLISDLSQGMRKKLNLVPLFLKPYRLIILDEPFNSIDLEYVYQLKQLIRKKSAESAFLISSHILETLNDLCQEFILLEDGKVKKTFSSQQTVKELESEIFDKNF